MGNRPNTAVIASGSFGRFKLGMNANYLAQFALMLQTLDEAYNGTIPAWVAKKEL